MERNWEEKREIKNQQSEYIAKEHIFNKIKNRNGSYLYCMRWSLCSLPFIFCMFSRIISRLSMQLGGRPSRIY